MTIRALAARFVDGPHVSAPNGPDIVLSGWLAELEPPQAAELSTLLNQRTAKTILLGIAEFSPYLFDLIRSDAARLIHILQCEPETHLPALIESVSREVFAAANEADVMRLLRRMKAEAALMIAL
jgi:glutamate-ammonia-ligase adenylyltransferase